MANIIKPYAKMLSPFQGYGPGPQQFDLIDGRNMLRRIEYASRISHRSEDQITLESYDKFLRSVVLNHGDWSVVEHEKVSVIAMVDRGITHEWVRHRLFSYTQESTRFVNYAKNLPPLFIQPYFTPEQVEQGMEFKWEDAINYVEYLYPKLIAGGVAPQIARSIFPNALASKIMITGNLRAWRHFFIMRTTKEAHPQMKEVSIPLLKDFQTFIPILFEDIVPEQRQAENLKLSK